MKLSKGIIDKWYKENLRRYPFKVLIIVIILILGFCYVLLMRNNTIKYNRNVIQTIGESIVAGLPKGELDSLPVNIEDLPLHRCDKLRAIMQDVIRVNKKAKYAYIEIIRNDRIFFVADSEPESSSEYVSSGTEYFEAKAIDRLPFIDGKTVVCTVPVSDRWGTWVSISIPIKDSKSGEIIAVFGMDYEAKSWERVMLIKTAESSALVILIIGLVLAGFMGLSKNAELKHEIKSREIAEKEIEINLERWKLAIENSGAGIWDWLIITDEVFVSPQFAMFIGWSEFRFSNGIREILSLLHPNDYKRVIKEYIAHVKGLAADFQSEFQIKTKDGVYKWVYLRCKAVDYNEKCKPIRITGTIYDIDAQKKYEQSLVESLKREQELSDLKSKFVSMASHEFRTPLASILLSAETLQNYHAKMTQESINQKISRIQNNVFFLSSTLEKVLDLAHIESGKLKVVPTSVNLPDLITTVIQEFESSSNKSHIFTCEFDNPHCVIQADKQMLMHAIGNLLSNSIKYSPKGTPIHIELLMKTDHVSINISDQGIGISNDDKEKIFDPFFRGSNTGTIHGTGLGLSLANQFIQLHNGNISLKSEENKGTTFMLSIPIVPVSEDVIYPD